MAWSTPDLSDITQVLKGLLQTAINNSPLQASSIQISCNSPDTARGIDGYCHLTLYLLHVGRDPFWRNTPVNGPRPQLNNAQPLSLNLSYLLTAWCDTDFTSEQRAMSIALQAIHSQPIVTQDVIQQDTLSQWLPDGEFTISIEADTIDEMSRLWQAFTVPIRLSALIRVGVVFIAPIAPTPVPSLPPTVANLSLSPAPVATSAPLLFAGNGQSFQPVLASADPAQVVGTTGPLIAVGGSTLTIAGNGLDLPSATDIFLSIPGTATEWLVTPWRHGAVQPRRLGLIFPAGYADPATSLPAPPAATPLPGTYNLTVGSNVPSVSRSNAIPLTIAPRVDGVTNPPQLLPDNTGLFAIDGAGFVSAATIVALGNLPLTKTAAAVPAAGEFTVNAAGSAITFKLPNPQPPAGEYPVLIQVNGIAAAPGWVVVES
jgi:hypothetical protein